MADPFSSQTSSPLTSQRPSHWFTSFLTAVLLLLMVCFVQAWPSTSQGQSGLSSCSAAKLFTWLCADDPETTLLVIAGLAGAIGSAIHALTSLAAHTGAGRYDQKWQTWYIVRIPVGAALGMMTYLIVRAGFVTASVTEASGALKVNLYGVAAISALTGIYSREVMRKLSELIDTLFGASAAAQAARGLTIVLSEPKTLAMGEADDKKRQVQITFDRDVKGALIAEVNGRSVAPTADGKVVKLPLSKEDVAQERRLDIKIFGAAFPAGAQLAIEVKKAEAPAPAQPGLRGGPVQVSAAAAIPAAVFQFDADMAGVKARANGADVAATINGKSVTVPLAGVPLTAGTTLPVEFSSGPFAKPKAFDVTVVA